MSDTKKLLRAKFRNAVFKRDNYRCAVCKKEGDIYTLAAHNIHKHDTVGCEFVPENGISVCSECCLKAEIVLTNGESWPGYSEKELYDLIGSSLEQATEAGKKS